jgi:hypothetical protein
MPLFEAAFERASAAGEHYLAADARTDRRLRAPPGRAQSVRGLVEHAWTRRRT